jgi:hypothetical protein
MRTKVLPNVDLGITPEISNAATIRIFNKMAIHHKMAIPILNFYIGQSRLCKTPESLEASSQIQM